MTLPCQNLPSPSQPTCPWRCLRCLLLHLPWPWQLAPVGRACRRCQAAQKQVAGAKNAEKTCEFCPLVLQFGLPWPPKIKFGHFCSPEVNMTTNNASIVKKRDRFNSTRKTSWRVNGIRDCKNVVNIILNSEQLRQTPSLCLARNPLGANRKNTEKRDSNDSKISRFLVTPCPPPPRAGPKVCCSGLPAGFVLRTKAAVPPIIKVSLTHEGHIISAPVQHGPAQVKVTCSQPAPEMDLSRPNPHHFAP